MKRLAFRYTFVVAVSFVAFVRDGAAQTVVELLFPLSLELGTPGARATAMGGTSMAVANDATAAATNPAGLALVSKREFSSHLRYSSASTRQPFLAPQPDSSFTPSLFSFAFPAGRYHISAFYQQQADSKFLSEVGFPCPGICVAVLRAVESELRLDQFGVSAAAELSPTVSLGGTVRLARADVQSGLRIDDADLASSFNVGVLFKPSPYVSAGAVYRHRTRFELDRRDTIYLPLASAGPESFSFPDSYELPTSFGFGVAVKPAQPLMLTLDVLRVKQSSDTTEVHVGAEYAVRVHGAPVALRGGFYKDEPGFPSRTGSPAPDPGPNDGRFHGTFGAGVVFDKGFQVDAAVNLARRGLKEVQVSMALRF